MENSYFYRNIETPAVQQMDGNDDNLDNDMGFLDSRGSI